MRIYITILILSIFNIEIYAQDIIRARDLGIPFELGPFLDKQVKNNVTSHKIHYAE